MCYIFFTLLLRKALILFVLLFLGGSFCLVGQEATKTEEVTIYADHQEKIDNKIIAKGNVEIHYKKIILFADRVELNSETKDVLAEGNVAIHLPNEVVSAESIQFNLDSTKGEIKKAFGLIQPSLSYKAESMNRIEKNTYSFNNAWMTSCSQPIPRWKFSFSRAKFKKDDYMEMWGAVLSIRKIPVFYFPYIRYPLGEDRKTGFLTPQLGYSGAKGVFFIQSFYWAIARNMDATVNLDYYSSRGVGGGLEYRYLFSEGTGGQLNAYSFFFKDNPEYENPDSAYIIRLKHNQSLPLNFNLVADVDYQSSFDFLREFDNNFKRAVVSNRRSQVFLTRSWSYFNLNMRASRFETYFSQSDQTNLRYNLPQISFGSSKIKLFNPLYFSFSSSYDSWQNGWQEEYDNGTQRRTQSIVFMPALTFPFSAIPWLTMNSSASTKFAYYFQSFKPNTKTVVDEPVLSQNYSAYLEFVGPVFFKIFRNEKDAPKLKHIIEPSFTYRYETPVASADRIITPGIFVRDHYFLYSLTNRFLIKQDKMPREILTFSLSQMYFFSPEDSPNRLYEIEGKVPAFSDISGLVRFYPSQKYSIDFSASFNPYYKTFSRLRMGVNLGNLRDNLFLRVNWFKSVNPYQENNLWDRHQINVLAGIKIPSLSIEAAGEVDFNILKKEMLYSSVFLIYHYQCLDFQAELKIFFFREKPETQFRLNFGLGNIGKTTDFLGGTEF
ncbi:MAG: LPS-assembly protein LptD [Candidatus Aminicenantes bacterium]|nr:LPS-assembly protein LptD [Candidatus Aminicenantes bacterium]